MGDFYPEKINTRFKDPKHAGLIEDANAIGKWASFVCGVSIGFSIQIDDETKSILDAKFQTNACGYTIATADLIAEKIIGQKLIDLHGLEIIEENTRDLLGEVSESRQHCIDICFDALQNALSEYRASLVEEWTGEKALICTCFGVSEEAIENLVKNGNLKTVTDVGDICNAGTGCGSCQPLIQEILDSQHRD